MASSTSLLVAAGLGTAAEHALVSLLALNGLRVSGATSADIETQGTERGHRTWRSPARRVVSTRPRGIGEHVDPTAVRHREREPGTLVGLFRDAARRFCRSQRVRLPSLVAAKVSSPCCPDGLVIGPLQFISPICL
jgi:hypothetical protein